MAYRSMREANFKSAQDEVVETSESSSSEEDEDDDTKSGNKSVKSRIEKTYSKLEDLVFKGVFEKRMEMTQIRLPVPTKRPVYKVTDVNVSDLLVDIHHNMSKLETELGGKEIWKGITTWGGVRLYGTENSADYSSNGMYHIPIGGIEVIVSDTLMGYPAIVNITVEEKF